MLKVEDSLDLSITMLMFAFKKGNPDNSQAVKAFSEKAKANRNLHLLEFFKSNHDDVV